MNNRSVLVVDDDRSFRDYVSALLTANGHRVESMPDARQAVARLLSGEPLPSVILLDVLLPDGDGIEVMEKIRASRVGVPVIMLSGVGHIRTVVEAMKLGASDFLMKPFDEQALESAINKVLEAATETLYVPTPSSPSENGNGFVTLNPEMRRLAEIIERVAHTDVPILIAGESGVGKEVMARHAHLHSGRQDGAFIKVNCAALPHELLESELFGYERGAFTGANADKPGKFELADGGTLLLDEIGEMSPLLQAKLLHVLQDGTFSRLGGRKTVKVDARIIAATNVNIENAVANGKFREDLYFRLNVIRIDIPALRDRKEDIPALTKYFFNAYRDRYKGKSDLPQDLLDCFARYNWPGNIRQLENYIKRFVILPDHHALFAELNPSGSVAKPDQPNASIPAAFSLLDVSALAAERAEQELVRRVMEETHGNRKLAARRMNICYKALLNKLKRWNQPAIPSPIEENSAVRSAGAAEVA